MTAPPGKAPPESRGLAALGLKLGLSRLALWWEGAWRALWPPLGILGAFLALACTGLLPALPPVLHLLILIGFAAAFGFFGYHAALGLSAPAAEAAARRLERDSGLAHRPLAVLADRPAGNDPVAQALWQAHRERAVAELGRLRVARPSPGLAARDPRALRAAVLVALVAGLGMAGREAPERFLAALMPPFAEPAAAPTALAARFEAWVTPPAYTGAPPQFLNAAGGAVAVPTGSRLHMVFSGSASPPEVRLGGAAHAFARMDAQSHALELPLTEGGALVLKRDGRDVAQWALTLTPDAPPVVAWDPSPARAGRGLGLRLPWKAEDDWGLVALRVELRLKQRPSAPPVTQDIPLPGGAPRQAQGAAQHDFSAHPWAGLEVEARLFARDGAEQEGKSEGAFLVLPERRFSHPVAQQLIALRRALSLDPGARDPARRELDRISNAPEAFEHDTGMFLTLRAARHRLGRDRRDEAVPEVQQILWDVAVALEEGRTDRTARALTQAREALREALEEARREGAERSPEERAELQRRIQELREAIRRHLEALAERMQRENNESLSYDPQQRVFDRRELERRTRRLEEAARDGRQEDAEREMAELDEMLQALEEGRTSRTEDRQRQQRQRGQQQMGALQDMVRREAEMLDRAHRRSGEQENTRGDQRRPQQQQQRPQTPEAREEAARDARTQRALRRALGELMQQFGELTGDVPAPLAEADRAMRDAAEALAEGRDPRGAQQQAIRALTEGGRQMSQRMQRQFGPPQPGEGEGEGEGQEMAGDQQGSEGQENQLGEGRDPLGRSEASQNNGSGDNVEGGEALGRAHLERLRSHQLQQELRRRGAERERPPVELEYIDRLLRRF
ncbi:MAG: DUF4175 family protein [Roseomonas sp.]|nr:DUF4175 family protein [Roseomonas sp.]